MDHFLTANIIFSKFSRSYMELKKDLPIRPSEMGVLNIITKRDGLFTPIMIADLLEVTKPMVASHIAILEKKGYITKQYSLKDKRSFYVIPTEKAQQLVREVELNLNQKLKEIEDYLGQDKFNDLVSLLEQARKIIEE